MCTSLLFYFSNASFQITRQSFKCAIHLLGLDTITTSAEYILGINKDKEFYYNLNFQCQQETETLFKSKPA